MAAKRVDLNEALKKSSYDHALMLTYNFDAHFFEEYCIEKLAAFDANGNISVVMDRSQYELLLSGPRENRPRRANLRYLLQPASVQGAFHPKVILLASATKGLLVLGSANLTRPGLTTNAELVGVYEYQCGKSEEHLGLFSQAFQFVSAVAERWPSEALRQNLGDTARDCAWLSEQSSQDESSRLRHNLDRPIWEEIRLDEPVEEVHVISRFFDEKPELLDKLLRDLNPKSVAIYTQDGTTTLTPDWVRHPAVRGGKVTLNLCDYKDGDHNQPLHAKAIGLQGKTSTALLFGSANFTSPALLHVPPRGNVESIVVLRGARFKDLAQVFDPAGSARKLTDEKAYSFTPRDTRTFAARSFELREVKLDGAHLLIDADIPKDLRQHAAHAGLEFSDGASIEVPLTGKSETLRGELDAPALARVNASTTQAAVSLCADDHRVAVSNRLLVTNLQEIGTGEGLRRTRLVREAQESAAQFSAVLGDLLRSGDQDAFVSFLRYCDIPIFLETRPRILRMARPGWTGFPFLRMPPKRRFQSFDGLHAEVVAFLDHHLRKLERHTQRPAIAGVPNFMHITLAMTDVVRCEVERIVEWLSEQREPISVDEWFAARGQLDVYLLKLEDVLRCLGDFAPAITSLNGAASFKAELADDGKSLTALCRQVAAARERLEKTRNETLRLTINFSLVPPYVRNVCEASRWTVYLAGMETTLKHLL